MIMWVAVKREVEVEAILVVCPVVHTLLLPCTKNEQISCSFMESHAAFLFVDYFYEASEARNNLT